MIQSIHINNYNRIGNLERTAHNGGTNECPQRPTATVHPTDQVTISEEARRLQSQNPITDSANANSDELAPEEQEQVDDLKQRDTEVKNHEAAHMSAGGTVVQGGATYQYETGPDGKMYAVAGEVSIDLSTEGTPEATIRKMKEVRRAAMAPAQPSSTDRAVAAQATQIEAQARLEKNEIAKEEAEAAKNPQSSQPSAPISAQRTNGLQINLHA